MPIYSAPTLSRPPSGDVDLVRSSVINGTSADPTIAFFGAPEFNAGLGVKWAHFHAAVDLKQVGRRPTFTLDFADWLVPTPRDDATLYWRRAGEGRTHWKAFNYRAISGSLLSAWNATAFDSTHIEIALTPTVTYQDLLDWLSTARLSPYVHGPPSASAFKGQNPSAPDFSYFDFPDVSAPNGVNVGTAYSFAFRITNLNAQPMDGAPKRKLICDWIHAGAQAGLQSLLGYADWLLSADSNAEICRRTLDHYFYLANTAGLLGGMARGVVEAIDPLLIATQPIDMR
jgi:hypothetical protein